MVKDEVSPYYIIKLCPLAFVRQPHEISYCACVPFHIDRKKGICLRYRLFKTAFGIVKSVFFIAVSEYHQCF